MVTPSVYLVEPEKEAGRRDAHDLLSSFAETRVGDGQPFHDCRRIFFGLERFHTHYSASSRVPTNIGHPYERRFRWNQELAAKIAGRITAAEIKALIEAREGRVIYAGLEYQNIGNASEDQRKIVAATKEAIRLLAQESPLNATRARKYGVTLDDDAK